LSVVAMCDAGLALFRAPVSLTLFRFAVPLLRSRPLSACHSSGDAIGVKVIKLDSVKTQLPYDYYSLPFCRPPTIEESAENLSEVLSGDRIENSVYKV